MKKSIIILALTGLFGCGTQPQLSEIINDMVVVTNFADNADFSLYTTYTLTMDTVGFVSNTSNSDVLLNDYTRMITAQVKKNLDQTGHTQVAIDQPADVGVNIVIYNDLSISQSYYPGYGGYGGYPYGGFYGGYYGGYYGGGYGYVQTSINQQAILTIQLYDIRNGNGSNAPMIWEAQIGDLINSYDTSKKTQEAIDQAFVQSTYLDR